MFTVYQTQWRRESNFVVGTIVVSINGRLAGLTPIDDECVIGSAFAPIVRVWLQSPSPHGDMMERMK
jgi:hypothetical protein